MEIVSELTTKATLINRINLSFDNNWLFVGDNELGFTLIKIEYKQVDKNKLTTVLKVAGNGLAYWKIF